MSKRRDQDDGTDGEKGKEEESYPMFPLENFEKDTKIQNDDDDDKDDDGDYHGIMHLLSVYAEKCSLNGIIFIKSSKFIIVKIIWTILLVAALVIMVYHLYKLGTKYYGYPKQTKIELQLHKLKFPAVTVCNVNPVRMSKMDMASQKLKDLISKINPEELVKDVDDWNPRYENYTYRYNTTEESTRKKREAQSSTDVTVKHRVDNFFDDYNFTSFDDTDMDDYSNSEFKDSWESESEAAAFDKIFEQFTNLYSRQKGHVRQVMGHQIQDMLVQCSFAGRKCVQRNFTLVPTSTLGNCYTIEYDKFVARQSGPSNGLSLILYLETDEYVPGITTSKGAQVVIHEPGTIAFPDDEGVALSAGMETKIGIRRVSISRLGDPHGDCTDTKYFKSQYGIKYTRQACQDVCKMEAITDTCGCYDGTKPTIYSRLRDRTKLPPCQTKRTLVTCMKSVKWNFADNPSCHCYSPCREIKYSEVISSRPWPASSFGNLIAKTMCKEKPKSSICDHDKMSAVELRENFIKVTIYYESLDYESIIEEADYTSFQFVSDIGGTVGLYVGLSVLSMFEIFHLLISIFRFLFCRDACKRK